MTATSLGRPLHELFLTLRGVPSAYPPEGELFFRFDPQHAWIPSQSGRFFDVEAECVRIHDALAAVIFNGLPSYYEAARTAPAFIPIAGTNSECPMSRSEFEKALVDLRGMPKLYELLYLWDCRKLVSSIQECSKEVMHLFGEFNRALNLDPLFYPSLPERDGVHWSTSPVVTNLFALLGFIFVRLHSLLDYTSKLAFEAEHLHKQFRIYPRLTSNNFVFGDRKRLAMNNLPGSLFEPSDLIKEIELYRNHIIHEGLFDDLPKVYRVIAGGAVVEKFILFPDRGREGQLERYNNRSLFYSQDDKINQRLPEIIFGFQERHLITLSSILRRLENET